MEHVAFRKWEIAVDLNSTRRAYQAIARGATEECSCCYCRNFAAARNEVYPVLALDLFARLGIDPGKENETSYYGPDSDLLLYGGAFDIVGSLEAGDDAIKPNGSVVEESLTDHFSIGFTRKTQLVRPPFAGQPLIQLLFFLKVPWVLKEPAPEE
jgi:hypothetical protein